MYDPGGVCLGQRVCHRQGVLQRFRRRQTPPRDRSVQRLAVHVLHGDKQLAVGFIDIVDMNDIRMIQRGCGLRFLHEAPPPVRVAQRLRQQYLQRHIPVQVPVARLVHRAHTALPQAVHDLEVSDAAANHPRIGIIVSRSAYSVPDRTIQQAFRRLIEQRGHLAPQFRIASASPIQESGLIRNGKFQCFVIKLFNKLPALAVHWDPGDYSSLTRSPTRAARQSGIVGRRHVSIGRPGHRKVADAPPWPGNRELPNGPSSLPVPSAGSHPAARA